jgi:hypothetical protein
MKQVNSTFRSLSIPFLGKPLFLYEDKLYTINDTHCRYQSIDQYDLTSGESKTLKQIDVADIKHVVCINNNIYYMEETRLVEYNLTKNVLVRQVPARDDYHYKIKKFSDESVTVYTKRNFYTYCPANDILTEHPARNVIPINLNYWLELRQFPELEEFLLFYDSDPESTDVTRETRRTDISSMGVLPEWAALTDDGHYLLTIEKQGLATRTLWRYDLHDKGCRRLRLCALTDGHQIKFHRGHIYSYGLSNNVTCCDIDFKTISYRKSTHDVQIIDILFDGQRVLTYDGRQIEIWEQ